MEKRFVSRAGAKLQHAIMEFEIDVKGKICADLGCCTGGFTDCLLQNCASKVYAIDTGYGLLEWKLRQNPQVIVMERTNAMHIELPELVDFICIDVGQTPQRLIIPNALTLLKPGGEIISLLKPNYEAEEDWMKFTKKGQIVPEEFLPKVIKKVRKELGSLGVPIKNIIKSPIVGQKGGNTEYLIWIASNGINTDLTSA